MTPQVVTTLVLVLVLATAFSSVPGWTRHGRMVWPPITGLLLVAAGVTATVAEHADDMGRATTALLMSAAGTSAMLGGGPVTTWIFAFVDRQQSDSAPRNTPTLEQAGLLLRGGAWIGVLERCVVFVTITSGFPEGIALVVAVKGFGRFSELTTNTGDSASMRERFIIGTLTSCLWAAAWAGVVLFTLGG